MSEGMQGRQIEPSSSWSIFDRLGQALDDGRRKTGGGVSRVLVCALLLLNIIWISNARAVGPEGYASITGSVKFLGSPPLVIYLESATGEQFSMAAESRNPSISSHDSKFEPAFQVVQRGGSLEIENNDVVLHNTHISENRMTLFNVATPLRNQTVEKVMPRTGLFEVTCDLHPWMSAGLAVVASPYYSVMRAPGHFKIGNIKPGNYQVHSLQSGKDEVIAVVNLIANGEQELSF